MSTLTILGTVNTVCIVRSRFENVYVINRIFSYHTKAIIYPTCICKAFQTLLKIQTNRCCNIVLTLFITCTSLNRERTIRPSYPRFIVPWEKVREIEKKINISILACYQRVVSFLDCSYIHVLEGLYTYVYLKKYRSTVKYCDS